MSLLFSDSPKAWAPRSTHQPHSNTTLCPEPQLRPALPSLTVTAICDETRDDGPNDPEGWNDPNGDGLCDGDGLYDGDDDDDSLGDVVIGLDDDGAFASPVTIRDFPDTGHSSHFAIPQRLCTWVPISTP